MRLVLLILLVLTLAAPVLAQPSRYGAPDNLADHIDLRLPENAEGPFPVVLFFPGCGGVQSLQSDYGDVALAEGWAVATIDSFQARGIGRTGAIMTVCTAVRLRGQQRAADLFAAMDILRADERLDLDKAAAVGWSHGSWVVLDALALAQRNRQAEQAISGLSTAYLLYPYCGTLSIADRHPIGDQVDITMVIVGRDRVVGEQGCRNLAEARSAEGSQIDIIYEPTLTHAFDAPDQRRDPRMRYDREGTARSHAAFAAVLRGASEP